MIKTNTFVQLGSMVVSALLAITFFILLSIDMIEPGNVMQSMILLVIAVTCLAIFSAIYRIESAIERKKK